MIYALIATLAAATIAQAMYFKNLMDKLEEKDEALEDKLNNVPKEVPKAQPVVEGNRSVFSIMYGNK